MVWWVGQLVYCFVCVCVYKYICFVRNWVMPLWMLFFWELWKPLSFCHFQGPGVVGEAEEPSLEGLGLTGQAEAPLSSAAPPCCWTVQAHLGLQPYPAPGCKVPRSQGWLQGVCPVWELLGIGLAQRPWPGRYCDFTFDPVRPALLQGHEQWG